MIREFGQKVTLEIRRADKSLIMSSNGLRVDFDIRLINGYSRGTIKVYNLSPEMVGQIIGGENYATLKVKLHDGVEHTLISNYLISNAYEEKKVPNSITSLFCFDSLRKDVLEKPVEKLVQQSSLKNLGDALLSATGFKSGKIEYKSFPDEKLNAIPLKPRPLTGSVNSNLIALSKEFNFNYYTDSTSLIMMYKPTIDDVNLTSLASARGDLKVDVNNLRANPVLGPSTISLISNLDPAIKPTGVIDTADMLTASVSTDEEVLQLARKFISDTISGFSKYQIISVEHRGSNFTKQWDTVVTAVAPEKSSSANLKNFPK
jgi:hypothetical protein